MLVRATRLGSLCMMVALAACDKKDAAGGTEAGAPSPVTSTTASATAYPSIPSGMFTSMPHPIAQPPAAVVKCRVMAQEGKATLANPSHRSGGTSLEAGDAGPGASAVDAGAQAVHVTDVLPDGAWIDLAEGAKVGIKVARSGRELSFVGPGRVRVCVGDDADTWLVRGRLDAGAFGGEPAGAELWVGTPMGSVRYPSTRFTLSVDKDLAIALETGTVWFFDRQDSKPAARTGLDPEGFLRVSTTFKTDASSATAAELVRQCETLAGKAATLAQRIRTTDGGIGALAAEHVASRRTARAACLWASTRFAAEKPAAQAQLHDLQRVLAEADGKWRTP